MVGYCSTWRIQHVCVCGCAPLQLLRLRLRLRFLTCLRALVSIHPPLYLWSKFYIFCSGQQLTTWPSGFMANNFYDSDGYRQRKGRTELELYIVVTGGQVIWRPRGWLATQNDTTNKPPRVIRTCVLVLCHVLGNKPSTRNSTKYKPISLTFSRLKILSSMNTVLYIANDLQSLPRLSITRKKLLFRDKNI